MEKRQIEIIELIKSHQDVVDFGDFGQGTSLVWVEKAEKRLGVKFPPSYIWWLLNFIGGSIYGDEVFSIYEQDFDEVIGGDVVYMTELCRKDGFNTVNDIVIMTPDDGSIFFLDASKKDINEEYPVLLFPKRDKYANDFIDFLKKRILE